MTGLNEAAFEAAIERELLARRVAEGPGAYGAELCYAPGGYRRRSPDDYDRALCLDAGVLIEFIHATQPRAWQRYEALHGQDARAALLRRVAQEVAQRGVVDVLRRGVRDRGVRFALAYFQPNTGLNPETQRLYQANQFTVVRQLRYSQANENALDMALFLNGLPLFSIELKNPLTGQTFEQAMAQYRRDRDPREPLLTPGRCIAHWAVDPYEAYFATALAGVETRFFPFNQGYGLGAGNPAAGPEGYATAYLWRQVWARDSVLNLVERFVHETAPAQSRRRASEPRIYVFPRYHQLDCVRRLIADCRARGAGQRYLVQHSAGSGKTYTIAWLAHQLSALHDAQDRRVFNQIIVITDRRVLDRQMREHVLAFEQKAGLVAAIDQHSGQLKEALEAGSQIIVTTLQKFPVIWQQVVSLADRRFAVIIDEAHSSQGGEASAKMLSTLAPASLAEAEVLDADDPDATTEEERILTQIRARQQLPNTSLFAFTATPRAETLETFGRRRPDGMFEAFSLYSMRQAIGEHFILDVLPHYTTYRTFWQLIKTSVDDPEVEQRRAKSQLRRWVMEHPETIAAKTRIIVAHFHEAVAPLIGGRAKAMIVTPSRLHAVRYRQALDHELAARGLPYRALVAFSGTVIDPGSGQSYTESGMNTDANGQVISESATAEVFRDDAFRFLVVANKFQTGFDQPLLQAMYVDKRLAGLNAVQTLSRLNRIYPGKQEPVVIDFRNDAETIREAFQPYYQATLLAEATDPNLLYRLQDELARFGLHDEGDIERLWHALQRKGDRSSRTYAALQPVRDRYAEADADQQVSYRNRLSDYVRFYAYLNQIMGFADLALEKLYHFARLALGALPFERRELPPDVARKVALESVDVRLQGESHSELKGENGLLDPLKPGEDIVSDEDERERLSAIVRELNEVFGLRLDVAGAGSTIHGWVDALAASQALRDSVSVNDPSNARLTFEQMAEDLVQDTIETNLQLYKALNDHPEAHAKIFDGMWERVLNRIRATMGGDQAA